MLHKAGKTWAATFRPLLSQLANASGENCYALPTLLPTIVFPAFGRSCPAGKKGLERSRLSLGI
ncbi:hypothetical protein [uncultured Mucilaginibacter sp.]|uniref:hypothetical protein n=1 Tax=uncultured Mucilaginibacter sp. TaxID=797541 RepID=UPI0025EBFDAD|nr:hypothetical protein [uncultured Mucilaginibacter sp.]